MTFYGSSGSDGQLLARIAVAAERIATALEAMDVQLFSTALEKAKIEVVDGPCHCPPEQAVKPNNDGGGWL